MNQTPKDPLDLAKLSAWAPELAKTFVALASDIALVIDGDGVIRTVEQGDAEPVAPGASAWVGRSWVDTVSGDTRVKIERLLKEASSEGIARRREVNHPLQHGTLAIAYTAVRLGANGPVLAVGRDMRAIAAIQERFIESQQDMERSYWSARQAESHYRLLFQVATDAVMVIDPETLQILDANPAATQLFAGSGEQLIGKHATVGFSHHSRGAVNELLATARGSGQSGEIRARLLGTVASTSVAATSFRSGDDMRLLVRVRAIDAALAPARDVDPVSEPGALDTSPSAPPDADAAVVTDSSGRILLADAAFLRLMQIARESDVKGRPLMDWLGTSEHPLAGLIAQVRRQGVVRRFAATAKPAHAPAEPVDLSAMLLTEGDQECVGFTIHRRAVDGHGAAALPTDLREGIERIVAELGTKTLTSLLGDVAALAERHFIDLALARSNGDSDAAAAFLGVGRERVAGAAGLLDTSEHGTGARS